MLSNSMRSFGIALCCSIIAGPVDASPTDDALSPAESGYQFRVIPVGQSPRNRPASWFYLKPWPLALARSYQELSAFSWESRAQEAAAPTSRDCCPTPPSTPMLLTSAIGSCKASMAVS